MPYIVKNYSGLRISFLQATNRLLCERSNEHFTLSTLATFIIFSAVLHSEKEAANDGSQTFRQAHRMDRRSLCADRLQQLDLRLAGPHQFNLD